MHTVAMIMETRYHQLPVLSPASVALTAGTADCHACHTKNATAANTTKSVTCHHSSIQSDPLSQLEMMIATTTIMRATINHSLMNQLIEPPLPFQAELLYNLL